jgi:competence protein ComEC
MNAKIARFVGQAFAAERDRWPLWIPVFLGGGIALYFALPSEPPVWAGIGFFAAALAAGFLGRERPAVMLCAVAMGAAAAGFTAAQWRTISVAAPVLSERHGPVTLTGRIIRVETFPDSIRVTLDKLRAGAIRPDRTPERARIRLRGVQPDMAPGQWLSARAVLTPPPEPALPGAFDFQRQLYFLGIGATGFAFGKAEVTVPDRPGGFAAWRLAVERLRQTVGDKVRARIGGPAGAVAAALMTGERSAIPESVLDAFRDSGLAHLLAISGLHIGLVAGILFLGWRAALALAPPLALNQPIKKWAAALAILGAFAYALVAGATIPTQRAFLMIGLVLVAVILDRNALSMRLVAWAAAVVLLIQPESLLGASFQMSFAAVIALIAAYEVARGWSFRRAGVEPPWWRRPAVYLAGIAFTTIVASTATAPFAIYHFNRFAAFGLLANLLAVPLTALLIMPAAVVAFLLMPAGLEGLALAPMGWGVEAVIGVGETIAGWHGAIVDLAPIPDAGLAVLVAGGLWLCLWRGRWRRWGTAAVAAGFASLVMVETPDVLVDGSGRLFAVKDANGQLRLSSRRAARFSGEVWLRRVGQGEDDTPPWPDRGPDGGTDSGADSGAGHDLVCDSLGCVYRAQGFAVALMRDPLAIADDCRRADIVVSAVPVPGACPSAMRVIDRFDLWRNGAHAIWLSRGEVRIESVADTRGDRPWVSKR